VATRDRAEWSRLIKTVWARRLTGVAEREGGDHRLNQAWSAAIAEAWTQRWDLDGIVPLRKDEQGHEWAVVVSRVEPSADMVLIHGRTPVEALEATVVALRRG